MKYIYLRLCLLITLPIFPYARQLRFAQVIWRHGDRAPGEMPYPNDPYTEEYWPRGWNQITEVGMQQLLRLGKFLRRRYIETGFISPSFNSSQVYIRSSDADRALTSAQAVAMGMFSADNNFSPLTWIPVPIHATSPGSPDPYCKATNIDCPLQARLEDHANGNDANIYKLQYANLFNFLENATGIKNFTYDNVGDVYDVQRELWNGLVDKQPAWINMTWPQYGGRTTLQIISELRNYQFQNQANTFEKAKALTGLTLHYWLEKMVQNIEEKSSKQKQKLFMYSSHDGTVLSLLYSLGVANGQMVPYSTTIIMEVYKSDEGAGNEVELYFRNETYSDTAYRLFFPNCIASCDVYTLRKIYQDSVLNSLDEMYQYCGSNLRECNHKIECSTKFDGSQKFIMGILVFAILTSLKNA